MTPNNNEFIQEFKQLLEKYDAKMFVSSGYYNDHYINIIDPYGNTLLTIEAYPECIINKDSF